MDRRKPSPGDSRTPPAPIPLPIVLDRALVGAFAALVVARPLVAGDDPGRLQLTSGAGPVSFNLCVFLLLIGAILWRAVYGRGGLDRRVLVVPLLLAGVGVAAYISTRLDGRYARPGVFVAWEWVAIAVAVYLARRLVPSVADSRGVLNVLLATAVSIAGLGIYQALSDRLGLPTMEVVVPPDAPVLAGDDEFYPELNRPPYTARPPRGTLDSPETLLVFLFLMLPLALAIARVPRAASWGRWAVAMPVILVAAAVAAIFARPVTPDANFSSAAVQLILEHPLLGVGPGNFSRFAPDALHPHSAWLGLAATTGLVGAGLFIAAVVVAARAAWPIPTTDRADPPPASTRWEFYLGGMAGLLLGFIWSTGEMPAEAPARELFKLGAAAILRAVLWFASFALLETVRLSRGSIVHAILVGVGFAIVFGFMSDAPGLPTIVFPMWVMLALATNFCRPAQAETPAGPWTRPILITSIIAATGLAIAYLVMAALPAWSTASAVRQARMASRLFPVRHQQYEWAKPGPEKANALTSVRGFLVSNMVRPLAEAADRDPTNAALWLELARWRRPLWQYQIVADPEDAARVADRTREAAEVAGHLDSRNLAPKRNLFESLLLFRGSSAAKQPERMAALNKLIGQIAEREPRSEVPLRYRVVKMLLDRGDTEGLEPEISTLLLMDGAEGSPHGSLTDEQQADLNQRSRLIKKAAK